MGRRNSKNIVVFIIGVYASFVTSCGKTYEGSQGTPYAAYVVSLESVGANDVPKYALTKQTFKYLSNFDNLDGDYVDFKRGGNLKIKEVKGSIVSADNFSGGGSPDLRYVVKDGAAVARDYPTLAQLSAYYQFEVIFDQFESVLGIKRDDFQKALKSKLRVFFEPKISIKSDDVAVSATIKLNAAYLPGQHQFVLFQRSAVEDVPLSSNLQVLSHEFGHSLFDYAFFANEPNNDEGRFENEYALSGINEGFADFVSFNYTGSADILRSSIDITSIADDRYFTKIKFKYEDLSPLVNLDEDICGGSFYCIGTLFVKSMVAAKSVLSSLKSDEYVAQVIASLQEAKKRMEGYSTSILPKDRHKDYEDQDDLTMSQYEYNGKVLGAFFRALAEGLPATTRTAVCAQLIENFGKNGFSTDARDGVCP